MNLKRNKTIIDLLNTVNGSLVIYAIILTLLFSIGETEYVLSSAFLLIIPVLSYFLEQHAKHIFTFALCHILIGIVFYILPEHLVVKIIYVIFTIIVMLYHFYRRIKREALVQNVKSYAYLIILIAIQFYANLKAYSQLSLMIQIITLLYANIYFTTVYLFNFTHFFANVVNTSANFHRIRRVNHSLIIGFLGIITAAMIGAFSVPTTGLLSDLKSIIVFILRMLFSWVKASDNNVEKEAVEESTEIIGQIQPIEAAEPNSSAWLFIEKILFKLCVVVVILAFAALIIYGLYKLYIYFHAAKEDETDKKEFVSPFYKEKGVKKARKNNKTKLPHIFLNNNEKIRRYFYHLIIHKYKDKVPANLTAAELLNLPVQTIGSLLPEGTDKFDPVLLKLYHKARYSNEMCSKEEVNIVKGIARKK